MKATSLPVLATRTPMCQSGTYPGAVNALSISFFLGKHHKDRPQEELFRVLESEHGIIIFHVILIQKEMDLFTLLIILDID